MSAVDTPQYPAREVVEAQLCRLSFFYFLQEFWEVIIAEAPVWNWHLEYLCGELEKVVHLVKERKEKEADWIINIPPGTSKSTICTVMLPAWAWTVDPSLRILTASYSSSLSTDHALRSRDIIRSDKYRRYFPEVEIKKDQDNKTHYKNTHSGERYASSVGGTIMGFHAHIIIVDDPLNPTEAASDVERTAANTWMDTTLSTRKVDKAVTPTILVMQRLHELDCTGNWLSKEEKKIRHICLPGEVSEFVKPPELKEKYREGLLDPVRMSSTVLKELRVNLGSYGYSGQISQRPAPPDGGVIKGKWFGRISLAEYNQNIAGFAFGDKAAIFADTAYTAKQENDPSALFACVYVDNILYVRWSKQVWKELPALISYIPQFIEQVEFQSNVSIRIEPKASGLSVIQTLKSEGFNAIALPAPKDDKLTRVHAVTPFIEAGRCVLVEGPWITDFISECEVFDKGVHDDQVDCLAHAIRYFARKGSVFL